MKYDDLKSTRDSLLLLYEERKKMGGFDVHADTIVAMLMALTMLTQHLIDKEKK